MLVPFTLRQLFQIPSGALFGFSEEQGGPKFPTSPYGESYPSTKVTHTMASLQIYKPEFLRCRFLSFTQDPNPKIWWGSQGGNSAKATDLKVTCHFQGFVKEQPPKQDNGTSEGSASQSRGAWGDFLTGGGPGGARRRGGGPPGKVTPPGRRALLEERGSDPGVGDTDRGLVVSGVNSQNPEGASSGGPVFGSLGGAENGDSFKGESGEAQSQRRILLSSRNGPLDRQKGGGGVKSFHHAHREEELEGSHAGRVSVGGVWWGGARENVERLAKRRVEPRSTPPEEAKPSVPDSKVVAVTGQFEAATTVRVNYDAIATRSGHVNAAYSMFLECRLAPEMGAFLEGMTEAHMVSTELQIGPAQEGAPSLSMRLVLDPTSTVSETGPPPADHYLTGCMGPIFGAVDERLWMEWIEYHRGVIGLDHLYVYVHDQANLELFQPYVDEGLLTFRHWQPTAPPDVLEKAHK
jgi:hypothetical protein